MYKADSQIQVRIDNKTKKQAQKVLNSIGMDISSAVKILLKQVVNTGFFPIELRDKNGFLSRKADELKEAMREARDSKESYSSAKDLIKSLK